MLLNVVGTVLARNPETEIVYNSPPINEGSERQAEANCSAGERELQLKTSSSSTGIQPKNALFVFAY